MVLLRKRKLYILTAVFFLALAGLFVSLSLPSATAGAEGLKGSGTKSDPYLVETREDFISFADSVNGGNSHEGEYFLQTADIDFRSREISPWALTTAACIFTALTTAADTRCIISS